MLLPRLTYAQRAAIPNPASTLLYYQTDNGTGFYYNAGTAALPSWVHILDEQSSVVRGISASAPIAVTGSGSNPTISLSAPANGILFGTGGGVSYTSSPSTTGQVLTYNGTTPTWGALGQTGTTVYGNASVALASTTATYTSIAGLSTLVNVPANSIVCVSTSGGIVNTSTSTSGFSVTDIAIYVDGMQYSNGHSQRILTQNSAGLVNAFNNWSIGVTIPLSAGNHMIEVRGKSATASGASVNISGDNTSPYQGKLTVLVMKQ